MNEGFAYPHPLDSASRLLGRSSIITRLKDLLSRAANSDLGVLLTGEPGVGKELAARELHDLRSRRGSRGPFVVIDRSDTTWRSDLAPNGSGRLQLPRGCTLFIDELADLPRSMQADLVHALQRESLDCRVVAATCRRPSELRNPTVLRGDLYFRVCESIIEVPPLRDRAEDIRALSDHFLAELGPQQRFSPEAHRALETYGWPGNVRELKAVVRRAALMHTDEEVLGVAQLFECSVSADRRDGDLKHLLDQDWDRAKDEFGRWYWTNVWQNLGGDVRKILEHTDVSPVWLRNRRKVYGLQGAVLTGGSSE